jgi:hypothetical protein
MRLTWGQSCEAHCPIVIGPSYYAEIKKEPDLPAIYMGV